MNNIFELVKASLTTRQAAEGYGLKVSRSGMCCCPFHDDHTPSMKVDRRYYCFGCGATGDVIDFAGKLLGLTPYEAAKRLARDFGIEDSSGAVAPPKLFVEKEQFAAARQFERDEWEAFNVLNEYHWLLKDWRERYAPETPEDEPNDFFVESLQMQTRIEYLLDILLLGDLEERVQKVDELKPLIPQLRERMERYHAKYGCPEKGQPTENQNEMEMCV